MAEEGRVTEEVFELKSGGVGGGGRILAGVRLPDNWGRTRVLWKRVG